MTLAVTQPLAPRPHLTHARAPDPAHALAPARARRSIRHADAPPESRGLTRDQVRLLVSDDHGHHHGHFNDLPDLLAPGDLIVVNISATSPASLPARGRIGSFRLNLSTRFTPDLWLAEPRWSFDRPGPLPLREGDRLLVAGVPARLITPLDGAPRLWFTSFDGDIDSAMTRHGEPIRYGYIRPPAPALAMHQTIFARVPGSAEMPSAARPFSHRVLRNLRRRGIHIARILLHTGVSSLDLADGSTTRTSLPEPFVVPPAAADAINRTRLQGRRIIAAGTTVVRAIESAADAQGVRATRGLTRVTIQPSRPPRIVDGLITGLHETGTSHMSLLEAIGTASRVESAYDAAAAEGYLWHEFGDSHLLFKPGRSPL